MGRSISLFSGYDNRENRTTNYCLLVLKMLYDENPRFLADFLATVGGEELGNHVGVNFAQQESTGKSIPDGVIRQRSFTVYLETKNYNWFYDTQLETHLDGLYREAADAKILLALCRFESEEEVHQFDAIATKCQQKDVFFKALSFEDFYMALPVERLPKNLADLIGEFRAYLDQHELLPNWRDKLDVVNCAGLPGDVRMHGVYICPAQGGAYTHRRCQYFGMYAGEKKVELLAQIRAVVDVTDPVSGTLLWQNVPGDQTVFQQEAVAKVLALKNEYPMRVFLLGETYSTMFYKDSPGGLYGPKVYFDVGPLRARNSEELATRLTNKGWKEIPKW